METMEPPVWFSAAQRSMEDSMNQRFDACDALLQEILSTVEERHTLEHRFTAIPTKSGSSVNLGGNSVRLGMLGEVIRDTRHGEDGRGMQSLSMSSCRGSMLPSSCRGSMLPAGAQSVSMSEMLKHPVGGAVADAHESQSLRVVKEHPIFVDTSAELQVSKVHSGRNDVVLPITKASSSGKPKAVASVSFGTSLMRVDSDDEGSRSVHFESGYDTEMRPSAMRTSALGDGQYRARACWQEIIEANQRRAETCILRTDTAKAEQKKMLGAKTRGALAGINPDDQSEFDLLQSLAAVREDSDWKRRLVLDPNSYVRLVWDIVSMILLGLDVVVIPMQFFAVSLPAEVQMTIASWWTLDLIQGFFLGYYHCGILEMRLQMIFRRYLATWLIFDVFIVSTEWVVLTMEVMSESGTSNIGDAIKSLRVFRALRALRLLRLVKMKRLIAAMQDQITSNIARTLFNVFFLVCCIVAIAHIIACGWYGVSLDSYSEGKYSWIATGAYLSDDPTDYKYITSLHWALTQFTPAGMEVNPKNTNERVFAVLVLLFAMVIFSSFVSSLTSTMTSFKAKRSEQDRAFELLRRFLRDMKVSHYLAVRVQRYLEHVVATRQRRLEIQDISLLNLLSVPLRMDLDKEIYGPILSSHAFFEHISKTDAAAMRKLCHSCLSILHLSNGDVLFQTGEPCQNMYFVLEGELKYVPSTLSGRDHGSCAPAQGARQMMLFNDNVTHNASGVTNNASGTSLDDLMDHTASGGAAHLGTISIGPGGSYSVRHGGWCCEAVLWVQHWSHLGVMRAVTNCGILVLNANQFTGLASTYKQIAPHAASYSEEFVTCLNELQSEGGADVLNDVWVGDPEELLGYALGLRVKHTPSLQRKATPRERRSRMSGLSEGFDDFDADDSSPVNHAPSRSTIQDTSAHYMSAMKAKFKRASKAVQQRGRLVSAMFSPEEFGSLQQNAGPIFTKHSPSMSSLPGGAHHFPSMSSLPGGTGNTLFSRPGKSVASNMSTMRESTASAASGQGMPPRLQAGPSTDGSPPSGTIRHEIPSAIPEDQSHDE